MTSRKRVNSEHDITSETGITGVALDIMNICQKSLLIQRKLIVQHITCIWMTIITTWPCAGNNHIYNLCFTRLCYYLITHNGEVWLIRVDCLFPVTFVHMCRIAVWMVRGMRQSFSCSVLCGTLYMTLYHQRNLCHVRHTATLPLYTRLAGICQRFTDHHTRPINNGGAMLYQLVRR